MKNRNYDFIKNKKKYFILSTILMAIVVIAVLVRGVNLDISFKGGTLIQYSYINELDAEKISTTVSQVHKDSVTVQNTGNKGGDGEDKKQIIVSFASTSGLTIETAENILKTLQETYPDNQISQEEINNVSPSIGQDFFKKSLVAVVVAVILLVIYIGIRFKKIGGFSAGVMAIVALIHDLIIVFGVFVILGYTIDNNFIAVLLTILGYSVNDTIVIYDRIRENRKLLPKKTPIAEIVNTSINQSLSRTINTTVSTVMALLIVCIVALAFNVPVIIRFALPMMIGMISGVYSTIFIAGPLWVTVMMKKEQK